jgi:hypothetical protein
MDDFDKLLAKLIAGVVIVFFLTMNVHSYMDNQTKETAIKAGATTAICIK